MDVAFSYQNWCLRFPELAPWVSSTQAALFWTEATFYLSPEDDGQIPSQAMRGLLLDLITAHIAALRAPINGQASSPLVGRIASATEGSVTVSTDYQSVSVARWFEQTKYGAQYWQMTAPFRTAQYFAPASIYVPF